MPFYRTVDEEDEKKQILLNSNKNLLTNKNENNLYFQICKDLYSYSTYDLFVFIQHLHLIREVREDELDHTQKQIIFWIIFIFLSTSFFLLT